MTQWHDPTEILFDTHVAAAFALVLLGIACWEVLSTIPFDWSIISGQRKWRWPMLAYFLARICMLLHIIPQAVNLNALREVPCQQLVYISKVGDVIGTLSVTVILSLRTIAVWHQSKIMIGVLGLLFAGQLVLWVMSLQYSRSGWVAAHNVCAALQSAPRPFLMALFAYTLCLDLVILILCAVRLASSSRRGGLASLLLKDGVAYFLAAFVANLIATIFAAMDLNPVMNILCLPFALVASAIAATRVFRHLYTINDSLGTGQTTSDSRGNPSSGRGGGFGRSRNYSAPGLALNEIRRDGAMPSISVHKVVEVDGEPVDTQYGDDVESLGYDSEEKRRKVVAL